MITQEYIDIFENYLSGELSPDEKLNFESRLEMDQEFRFSFEKYKELECSLKRHFERESLKNKLRKSDTDSKIKGRRGISRLNIGRFAVIGSAAAILLSILIYYNKNDGQEQASFLDMWPYEEGLIVKMGSSIKYNPAMNAYRLENWEEAILLFSEFKTDTAAYFEGSARFYLKDYEIAKKIFLSIDNNSSYYPDAQIRFAILSIYCGENQLAKITLDDIIQDSSSEYYGLALQLLEMM